MISVIGMSMYICICTISFTCMCVLVYVRAFWCMYKHLFIPTLVPSHVQGCVCTCVCAFTMVPVLSYVVLYVFISLYIYICLYSLIHMCADVHSCRSIYSCRCLSYALLNACVNKSCRRCHILSLSLLPLRASITLPVY